MSFLSISSNSDLIFSDFSSFRYLPLPCKVSFGLKILLFRNSSNFTGIINILFISKVKKGMDFKILACIYNPFLVKYINTSSVFFNLFNLYFSE